MSEAVTEASVAAGEAVKNETIPISPEGSILAYSSLYLMAIFCIYVGSLRSVCFVRKHKKEGKKLENSIGWKDARLFPLTASCVLFGLYCVFKYNDEIIGYISAAIAFVKNRGVVEAAESNLTEALNATGNVTETGGFTLKKVLSKDNFGMLLLVLLCWEGCVALAHLIKPAVSYILRLIHLKADSDIAQNLPYQLLFTKVGFTLKKVLSKDNFGMLLLVLLCWEGCVALAHLIKPAVSYILRLIHLKADSDIAQNLPYQLLFTKVGFTLKKVLSKDNFGMLLLVFLCWEGCVALAHLIKPAVSYILRLIHLKADSDIAQNLPYQLLFTKVGFTLKKVLSKDNFGMLLLVLLCWEGCVALAHLIKPAVSYILRLIHLKADSDIAQNLPYQLLFTKVGFTLKKVLSKDNFGMLLLVLLCWEGCVALAHLIKPAVSYILRLIHLKADSDIAQNLPYQLLFTKVGFTLKKVLSKDNFGMLLLVFLCWEGCVALAHLIKPAVSYILRLIHLKADSDIAQNLPYQLLFTKVGFTLKKVLSKDNFGMLLLVLLCWEGCVALAHLIKPAVSYILRLIHLKADSDIAQNLPYQLLFTKVGFTLKKVLSKDNFGMLLLVLLCWEGCVALAHLIKPAVSYILRLIHLKADSDIAQNLPYQLLFTKVGFTLKKVLSKDNFGMLLLVLLCWEGCVALAHLIKPAVSYILRLIPLKADSDIAQNLPYQLLFTKVGFTLKKVLSKDNFGMLLLVLLCWEGCVALAHLIKPAVSYILRLIPLKADSDIAQNLPYQLLFTKVGFTLKKVLSKDNFGMLLLVLLCWEGCVALAHLIKPAVSYILRLIPLKADSDIAQNLPYQLLFTKVGFTLNKVLSKDNFGMLLLVLLCWEGCVALAHLIKPAVSYILRLIPLKADSDIAQNLPYQLLFTKVGFTLKKVLSKDNFGMLLLVLLCWEGCVALAHLIKPAVSYILRLIPLKADSDIAQNLPYQLLFTKVGFTLKKVLSKDNFGMLLLVLLCWEGCVALAHLIKPAVSYILRLIHLKADSDIAQNLPYQLLFTKVGFTLKKVLSKDNFGMLLLVLLCWEGCVALAHLIKPAVSYILRLIPLKADSDIAQNLPYQLLFTKVGFTLKKVLSKDNFGMLLLVLLCWEGCVALAHLIKPAVSYILRLIPLMADSDIAQNLPYQLLFTKVGFTLKKVLSKDNFGMLLLVLLCWEGCVALAHLIKPAVSYILRLIPLKADSDIAQNLPYQLLFTKAKSKGSHEREELVNWEFDTHDLCSLALCSLVGIFHIVKRHWISNDVIGVAFSLYGIEALHLASFKGGIMLLAGLFVYDVFWVFATDVMATVATSIKAPILLMFPQDLLINGFGASKMAMLGLGDIVIPGIFLALLLRFGVNEDDKGEGKKEGTRRIYFYVTMLGYCLGLVITIGVMHYFKAAQPALLYLVPACVGAPLLLAVIRGEVGIAFSAGRCWDTVWVW